MLQLLVFFAIFTSIIFWWAYAMSILIIGLFPFLSAFTLHWMLFSLSSTTLFIVGLMAGNVFQSEIISVIYRIGSIWLWALTITGGIAIVFMIIAQIFGLTYTHVGFFILFIILALTVNIWGIYASYVPRITEYSVNIEKNHDWHGKKIIMVADTHYGNIYGREDARRLVERINSLSWEIVIIPGDFFDGPKIDYEAVAQEFRNIKAPLGTLFANGNHEEYRNTGVIIESLENAGITILNNKKVTLNGMTFAGVTYHASESAAGLGHNLDTLNLKKDEPVILLKHKPTLYTTIQEYPIDLVVSGHTHRGQMWPFSYITDLIYKKYSYGMNINNTLTSITTSGVGSWWPPQRIGTRSEIVVINIQ